jgi:GT2 family glycosyltransferase
MQSKNPLVSVIIINWNGKHFLDKCLTSLYAQKYKNIEVIFVDNASTDGSINYVKEKFPKTKIVINKENLGFADANNIGYRVAKGEYILFLNNDTEVTDTFIIELLVVLENNPKIGGAQSKILLMDEPDRLDSVGAFLTKTGFLFNYGIAKKDSPKYNKQIDLYTAKGACMMFKKHVLEEILVDGEILDSRYFVYFEETDMCHRVLLAGYKIVFVPKSAIYHKMGGTSTKLNNSFVQYHSFKNRLNSYTKNLSLKELIQIMPVHIVLCEGFALFSLLKGNLALFKAVHQAYFWNITELKTTIKKREYIQRKIKKVTINFSKLLPVNIRPSYYYYLVTNLKYYVD